MLVNNYYNLTQDDPLDHLAKCSDVSNNFEPRTHSFEVSDEELKDLVIPGSCKLKCGWSNLMK